MKILHVNTTIGGGAGIAATRLHMGLMNVGIDSSILTQSESSSVVPKHFINDGRLNPNPSQPSVPTLSLRNYLSERFTKRFSRERAQILKWQEELSTLTRRTLTGRFQNFELFSLPQTSFDITKTAAYQHCDIVHLHWVANFLDYESFFSKNKKPVVWTLHDENPFRGGFHYEQDELRNRETHGAIDNLFKKIKSAAIAKQDSLTLVCPSNWLANKARDSHCYGNRKVLTIRNGIDCHLFSIVERELARSVLEIPQQKTVFLFVAQDATVYRKGLDLLSSAMRSEHLKDCCFVTIGQGLEHDDTPNRIDLGPVQDQLLMKLVYNAADYFVLPSREDNLPNTMVESLACGTPVISFDISDNRSIIEANGCGMIADSISTESLERALIEAKSRVFDREKIAELANRLFEVSARAKEYAELYQDILAE